jgi:hypothetical protein
MKRGMMKRSSSIDGTMSGSIRGDASATPPYPRLRHNSHDHSDDYMPGSGLGFLSGHTISEGSPNGETEEEHDIREILFESIPEPYCEYSDFQRVRIDEVEIPDPDSTEACRKLTKCLEMRKKWIGQHPVPPQDLETEFENTNGPGGPEPGTPVRKRNGVRIY